MHKDHNVENEETFQDILQTVTVLIRDLINNTVPSIPSQTSDVPPNLVTESTTSRRSHETHLEIAQVHSNQRDIKPTYELFRAVGQFTESRSDVNMSNFNIAKNRNQTNAPCVPPSYSSVIKQGRPSLDIRRDVRSMEGHHISPFNRIPPPSYAEIHGVWSREISNASSEQILLGPDPIYIWCTHCATVVITVTQAQRSKFTHLTAAALCLLGCWPCAMLPYCMNSCMNIYHYCPDCNYLFGMYRPW